MNRYQKALHFLTNKETSFADAQKTIESSAILKELVGRATPMKYKKGTETNYPYCPKCEKPFPNKQVYCSGCGQKIDWGGEDE